MSDTPDWAWKFQTQGAFIKGRTAHLVREASGMEVVTECGRKFHNLHPSEQYSFEDEMPQERHRCGNCPWETHE